MNLDKKIRQKMIDRLIEDDIQTVRDSIADNDVEYLDAILRGGIGYNNMTDKGIVEEFFNRSSFN
jgi:hypothetical protein